MLHYEETISYKDFYREFERVYLSMYSRENANIELEKKYLKSQEEFICDAYYRMVEHLLAGKATSNEAEKYIHADAWNIWMLG